MSTKQLRPRAPRDAQHDKTCPWPHEGEGVAVAFAVLVTVVTPFGSGLGKAVAPTVKAMTETTDEIFIWMLVIVWWV